MGCVFKSNLYTFLLSYTLIPILVSILLLAKFASLQKRTDEASIKVRNKIFSNFLVIPFLILHTISLKIFATFSCREYDDGSSKLMIDHSIDCNAPSHNFHKSYATLMICIFPVGVLLMQWLLLWKNKKELKGGQVEREKRMSKEEALRGAIEESEKNEEENPKVKSLNFLYGTYQLKYWYFEVLETLRKLSLTGYMVFFGPDSEAQVCVSLLISIFSLSVYNKKRPLIEKRITCSWRWLNGI